MREVKPTQKPVPSSDIKDLFFNSGLLDIWATSLERKYIDRFGNCHLTAAGMEWLFKELVEKFKVDMNTAIVAAGYITIDSFQQGADLPNNELTQRNHILRDETTGEYYRWDGDLPKQVPAGSTPQSTGGIGKGAWVSVGDASFRSDVKNGNGSLVGTQHRENLSQDLLVIDRCPDGYGNDIQAVLSNGADVELNKDYQSDTQVLLKKGQMVSGAGGSLEITSGKQSAFRADTRGSAEAKDFITINNVVTFGQVQPDSNTSSIDAYSVFLRDNAYSLINGVYSEGFTGGVALTNTRSTTINNVRARSTVYHPEAVRGAYGVFLDECRNTIINGVHFTAGSGNDGRHLLYVSRGGGGNSYDGCVNLIATNLIARYNNKNNRDMWSFNYRKSMRTIQANFITEGSNGGVAYNCENGNIEKNILSNGHIQVLKYQNGIGVYGVNHDDRFTDKGVNGWLASNLIIEVKPKDATITGDGCIGYKIASKNGMLANVVTNVHTLGAPIYINNGASNILISNVLDYLNDGSTETAEACIVFAGDHGTMQNISILGIKTPRKIFRRITAAVNVTVDFPRSAKIFLNAGVSTVVDEQELINRVSVGATSISVILNDHVTQLAADSASVRMVLDGGIEGYTILRYTSNKELQIRFYNAGGTLQNPSTVPALSCLVTLYS